MRRSTWCDNGLKLFGSGGESFFVGVVGACLLALFSPFVPSRELSAQTAADVAEARGVIQQAFEKREAEDFDGFLKGMEEALRLRPGHPEIHFMLARGYAQAGRLDESLRHLTRVAEMGLALDPSGDEGFAPVAEEAGFQDVVDRIRNNGGSVGSVRTYSKVPVEVDFIPEGLAFDPRTGDSFLGSVRKRRIVRFSPGGEVTPFAAPGAQGLASVMGMVVDPDRRLLWVCSSGVEQAEGLDPEERGRSALYQYDLDTGELLVHYHFNASDDQARSLGDIALDGRGRVYVSDATGTAIYTVRPEGDFLETFVQPGRFVSPQGIAVPDDGPWIYIADYSRGVVRVDRRSGETRLLKGPADAVLLGIDELAWYDGDLIAVQNGTNPRRILRLQITEELVTGVEVLAAQLPEWSEPTLGYVHEDEFRFVANSQWDRFQGAELSLEGLEPPLIQVIRLR